VCGQDEAEDVSMSYFQSTNPVQESKPNPAPLTVYIQKHNTHSASHHPKKQHVKRNTKLARIEPALEFPIAPLPPPPPPPPPVVSSSMVIQPTVVVGSNVDRNRRQFLNFCDHEILCSLRSLCTKWEKKMSLSMTVFLEDHLHYRAFSSFVMSSKLPSVQEVCLLETHRNF